VNLVVGFGNNATLYFGDTFGIPGTRCTEVLFNVIILVELGGLGLVPIIGIAEN
jgi:hypothetical protein